MTISKDLAGWELEKALYLIQTANNLKMDLEDTEVNVNNNSGYVYLYNEFYNFCLYMNINCELQKSDVYVIYTDMETGAEIHASLNTFKDLKDIENWCYNLEYNNIKNND
jgi:hypothetical protein